MAVEVTDSNFEEIIIKAGKPALVDFWAEWCGPCKAMDPVVEEIAGEYGDKIVVGKVDVESCSEISSKYGIRNIPTMLFFKDGEVADKQVGGTTKDAIVEKINALL